MSLHNNSPPCRRLDSSQLAQPAADCSATCTGKTACAALSPVSQQQAHTKSDSKLGRSMRNLQDTHTTARTTVSHVHARMRVCLGSGERGMPASWIHRHCRWHPYHGPPAHTTQAAVRSRPGQPSPCQANRQKGKARSNGRESGKCKTRGEAASLAMYNTRHNRLQTTAFTTL